MFPGDFMAGDVIAPVRRSAETRRQHRELNRAPGGDSIASFENSRPCMLIGGDIARDGRHIVLDGRCLGSDSA